MLFVGRVCQCARQAASFGRRPHKELHSISPTLVSCALAEEVRAARNTHPLWLALYPPCTGVLRAAHNTRGIAWRRNALGTGVGDRCFLFKMHERGCISNVCVWIQHITGRWQCERDGEKYNRRAPDKCAVRVVCSHFTCCSIHFPTRALPIHTSPIRRSLIPQAHSHAHQSLSHLCCIFDLFMRFKSITCGGIYARTTLICMRCGGGAFLARRSAPLKMRGGGEPYACRLPHILHAFVYASASVWSFARTIAQRRRNTKICMGKAKTET